MPLLRLMQIFQSPFWVNSTFAIDAAEQRIGLQVCVFDGHLGEGYAVLLIPELLNQQLQHSEKILQKLSFKWHSLPRQLEIQIFKSITQQQQQKRMLHGYYFFPFPSPIAILSSRRDSQILLSSINLISTVLV